MTERVESLVCSPLIHTHCLLLVSKWSLDNYRDIVQDCSMPDYYRVVRHRPIVQRVI